MEPPKKQKHVIFLGAGASFTSGYPLANDLRLLLSSYEHFRKFVEKAVGDHVDGKQVMEGARQFWGGHGEATSVFRYGGFATVDEFCRVASASKQDRYLAAVRGMRFMSRYILALHNPEDAFESSDYYGFVQRLFDQSLCRLRSDVVVLSFNYDPYLEYLLLRAQNYRATMSDCRPTHDEMNAMCGGFIDPGSWAARGAEGTGFVLLKLHGSICMVDGDVLLSHKVLFEKPVVERMDPLTAQMHEPFIVFPWELFDTNGTFSESESFPKVGYNNYAHGAFRATWERARREVQDATKVSFVGLSMHEYLEFGLAYLFKGKRGFLDVVMADPLNVPLFDRRAKDAGPAYRPTAPAYHLRLSLKKIAPGLQTPPATGVKDLDGSVHIRGVADFKEFIRTEMK